MCYVLGVHRPFAVLNGFTDRYWGILGTSKTIMLKNSIMLVRFNSAEGKKEFFKEESVASIVNPSLLKAWKADMEFSKKELATVYIWIKLSGLILSIRV